jgi:CubicO group peptidase (beta-lactamase class C family)
MHLINPLGRKTKSTRQCNETRLTIDMKFFNPLCIASRCISFTVLGIVLAMTGRQVRANEAISALSKQERIAYFRDATDKLMKQLHSRKGPGLAVWLEVDGETVYNNWGGMAQRDKQIPIDSNTAFELASASKPLTAAAIMQLVEAGLLGVDDAAIKWLPDLPPQWSKITVRQLLTQSAGVPDYMNQINSAKLRELDGLTNQQLLEKWRNSPVLNFEPGSKVEYSNSNYVLLAEIIAKACGISYGECLRKHMFEPLGMSHTRVDSEQPMQDESLALNYAATVRTKGIQLKTEGPTGIYSSLGDLAIWLRAFRDGKIVNKRNAQNMAMPGLGMAAFENGDKYGMGWVLAAEDTPAGAYSHPGQKDGYRTLIRGNPTHKVNYIILSNGGDFVQPMTEEVQNQIQELFESAL